MNKAVKMSILKTITGLLIAATLAACGGGGGEARTPVAAPAPGATSAVIASLVLSAPNPLTLNADGTSSITMTIRALDASNGLVKGAAIGLSSTGNSILSQSIVTTDATTGIATATLVADSTVLSTRLATVTASCSSCTATPATLQVQINGATLTVTSTGGSSLIVGGSSVNLSAVVTDAKGATVANKAVVFAVTDPNLLVLSNVSAVTNANGIANATVSGVAVGTASVNVTSLGNAKAFSFNVTAGNAISVVSPTNNATMATGIGQVVTVSAPGASSVTFTSTLGTFSSAIVNSSPFVSTLTSTLAGSATVTVVDNLGHTATVVLFVSPPSASANGVILNASQTTLPLSTSTSTPSIRMSARALYTVGNTSQPVAGVPVFFTMAGGPGSGEYLTPAYQLTDNTGYAYADFYSGSSASIQNGIVVTANIQNQSGPSASKALTVGGQALSVAFGSSSVIRESTDKTLYIQDYSVQVTDANNNPVANSVVTLRARPVAFSTGSNCTVVATYCSEDANSNSSLDSGEDGVRYQISNTDFSTLGQCPASNALPAAVTSKIDGFLTPQNSMGGAVPATVTTDSSGIAPFSVTFLKASALWIVDRLSASVSVNGTESGSSTVFRLPGSVPDTALDSLGHCFLPPSPY